RARGRSRGECGARGEGGPGGRAGGGVRTGLGVASGYVSRLLRSLERAGLVDVAPRDDDRRVRAARLTAAGRSEVELLDRRSDDLARSFLEPLGEDGRARLVAAMGEVERLLTAALVRVEVVDPARPEAERCLRAYFDELAARFDAGFDPGRSISAGADELRLPAGAFLLATLRGEAVGCGALKLHGAEPAELKRMWVADAARGLGLGRRLPGERERGPAATGAPVARLETTRSLHEAIGLYRSSGSREVPAFNDEPYAHHWFEKRLEGRAMPPRPRPPASAGG